MYYRVDVSEGRVGSTWYSQDRGSDFSASEEEAREYLMRLTHEEYIGGTSRQLILLALPVDGPPRVVATAYGCDCHIPYKYYDEKASC